MEIPIVETYAGTGSNRSADGPLLRANVGAPTGLYCLDDEVYVCDYYGNSIRKLDMKKEMMTTVAGNGTEKGSHAGEALISSLPTPRYIFPDGDGGWIVTSYVHGQIIRLKEGRLSVVAGTTESGYVEGPADKAQFDYPRGGCADPRTGSLYITDYGNHRVRIISPFGLVSSIGSGNKTCKDGSSTECAFNGPLDLCIGPNTTFYVCELGAVRIIDGVSHEVKTFAGTESCGLVDGPRLSARFSGLTALAWRHDTMFLADFNNHLIRMISPTGMVSTFAGSTKGCLDGPADKAQFQFPWGLCLTNAGHLLISDSSNNKIRIIRNAAEPVENKPKHDFCSFETLRNVTSFSSPQPPATTPALPSQTSSILFSHLLPPFDLHPALAHLAYPTLLTANFPDTSLSPSLLKDLATLLYTNQLPPETEPIDIINMIYLAGKLLLPIELMPYLQAELSRILPRLPIPNCMTLLLHINDNCASDETLISLTIAAIQPRIPTADVPEACAPLIVNGTFALNIMSRLLAAKSVSLPDHVATFPGWFIQSKLTSLYWSCVATPKDLPLHSTSSKGADSNNSTSLATSSSLKMDLAKLTISPLPAELNCNFTICNSDGFEMRVHDWVLYARWPYFQNLVVSGFSEVTNGRLELPSESFSALQLRVFVRYLYTEEEATFDSDDLKIELLRNAPQFNLVDLSSPPVPSPHFKKLLSHCREVLDIQCSVATCITQYKLMAEMGSPQQLNSVGKFILDNFSELIKSPAREKELQALGVRTMGEMWLRSRKCDPADWKP